MKQAILLTPLGDDVDQGRRDRQYLNPEPGDFIDGLAELGEGLDLGRVLAKPLRNAGMGPAIAVDSFQMSSAEGQPRSAHDWTCIR